MKKNKLLELEIESIGFEGVSIAKNDGKVYFVKGAMPGDIVLAQLRRKRKNYIEASVKEIIKPSIYRVDAFCKYFGICGGCTWQCLDYEQQLKWKKQQVIDAYERIGKVNALEYCDVLPAAQNLYYRNKMDFSFSASRWLTNDEVSSGLDFNTNFALGLHIPGRYDKVIDIETCKIQDEKWNEILTVIRNKALELEVTALDTHKNEGFLKGLCLRKSIENKETMAILVTNPVQNSNESVFIEWYKNQFPTYFNEINSVVIAENPNNSVNVGEIVYTNDKDFITENILDISYRISPFSFFQTNSYQLNKFIGKIIELADVQKSDIVWDLYCGTGSITLPMSKKCKEIYGVELVESSILDARANAKFNNIENSKFFVADLHSKQIPDLLNTLAIPNTIILDPPRSGLHKNLISHLLNIKPQKIVYVSCNPATQARDLAFLDADYIIKKVCPVDMFPHTYHIEAITVLEKK